MTAFFTLFLLFTPLLAAQSGTAVCDVKQFGAAGDGKTLDTQAINKASDACSAAGGGLVSFPAGTYVSGTVYLKSNITLYLDSGATLLGSKNYEDYKLVSAESSMSWPVRVFLFGDHLVNVTIAGHGTIDGNRVYDEKLFREKTRVTQPEQMPGWFITELNRGPHTISLQDCTRVRVRDIQVKDSPNYAFRLRSCEDVNVRGVTIQAGWDGFNINNSKFVTISDCHLQTGDDAIAGTGDEHMLISNCLLNSSANAVRLTAGNKHIQIANCSIYAPGVFEHRTSHRHSTLTGILIQPLGRPKPGSSLARNAIEDIMISNVSMQSVRRPFVISTSGSGLEMHDIAVNNITVTGAGKEGSVIRGDPEVPITNVALHDIRVAAEGGVTEATFPSPAYGFACSNVKNLEFRDVALRYEHEERRPALTVDLVGALVLDRFAAKRPEGRSQPIELATVGNVMGEIFTPAYKAIRLDAETATGPVAGEAFEAVVVVEGSGVDGLHRVDVKLGERSYSRWVWLNGRESKEVAFADLECPKAGVRRLEAAHLLRTLSVRPRPQSPSFVFHGVRLSRVTVPPISVSAVVSNIGAKQGQETVRLSVDRSLAGTARVDLPPGGSQTVTLKIAELSPGKHALTLGSLPARSLEIPGAVASPYKVAGNGRCCYQFVPQPRFYILAPRSRYEIADEYQAVFVERGLRQEGTVTVKIDNPNRQGGWAGRTGLIVRNEMVGLASGGYLVLAASASSGWSLQWDEDGDGILDHHTEFDGYTVWPNWLKLVRSGDRFTGYYSTDRLHWVTVGSASLRGAQPQLDVGMFAAATTGEYSEFAVQPAGNEPQ